MRSKSEREKWLPVPGFEGLYEVSDHGRVRSLRRRVLQSNGHPQTVPERILRPGWSGSGSTRHLKVDLCRDRRPWTRRVHHLVMEAFVGPRPDGMEGCHNDGDPRNNRLDNLRWDTPKANHADKRRHGTACLGERHGSAKLTEHQVRHYVIPCIRNGVPLAVIARRCGVRQQTISQLRHGRTWSHVTGGALAVVGAAEAPEVGRE